MPSRKRLAPTAGQVNDVKLVRTSVLCNGDLATYPPQGRRGNNSAALGGRSHIPSASRALSHQHHAHRLPDNLSSQIEDELYALNLLQLTRDYPLSPYCLRYPLDFLLDSLPEEVRRSVVVLLDPSTTPELEGKLFGEDEEAFEEAMEYLEQDRQEAQPQGSPQGQPKLSGGDGHDDDDDDEGVANEEEEEDQDDTGSEDGGSEEFDPYPAFFRAIRHHGEYVFWPVDAGGHQWLLCVLHLKCSWSHGPYEQVTDFAVVDPEWSSSDGSGSADSVSVQSRERVSRVMERLVKVFKAGGIEINTRNTQQHIWCAPSSVLPPAAAAQAPQVNGDGGDGANEPQWSSSPRWESGVRCFQLVRELLGRATGYACPGMPGYDDERFFKPAAGWVDVDAVRHEMVGMALQRCNAALGYACRYYLAPIDTLILVGGDGGDGNGDGNGGNNADGDGGGGGGEISRIVQPDSLRPSRVGKRMHGAPEFFDMLNDPRLGHHQAGGSLGSGAGRRKPSGGGVIGGALKVISHNAGNVLGGISGSRSGGGGGRGSQQHVNGNVTQNPPQTPPPTRHGMHASNSSALNRRPSKRTAADADLDGGADGEDGGGGAGGGGVGDGDSPTRQIKRARTSGVSVRK